MSEFILGSAVALIAAGIGYFANQVQQRSAERRRRQLLANLFLIELYWLEDALRSTYSHPKAATYNIRLTTETYERHEADLLLFPPATVRLLVNFYGILKDLNVSWVLVRGSDAPTDENADLWFRAKAGFGAKLVPKLKHALEEVGGQLPESDAYEVVKRGTLPELPPPAFARIPHPQAIRTGERRR
jgi:hypothetical protein